VIGHAVDLGLTACADDSVNRRDFLLSLLAIPGALSGTSLLAADETPNHPKPQTLGRSGQLRFVLHDLLEHPFYWWPRTLLSYPIQFDSGTELERLALTRVDTGERIPIQFSDVVPGQAGSRAATLNFFGDLPSGARREFLLAAAESSAPWPEQVTERREGETLVVDNGAMRVRLPASQKIHGVAPGPVMQVSRGGPWFGESTLAIQGDSVTQITTRRTASGPLFYSYEVTYETEKGTRCSATIKVEAGMDFVRVVENMEGLPAGGRGLWTSTWSGLGATHRQAPNHPFPLTDDIRSYDDYPWEKIDAPFRFDREPLADGQLPFTLGVYERAPGNFHTGTFANFWNRATDDALGLFIDDVTGWQDHEYAYEIESPLLQVRYFHRDGRFYCEWPLARGRRSTCIACYDHAKDRAAMRDLESKVSPVGAASAFKVPLTFTSHTLFLQNRYGSLDLNRVKDWVLSYPDNLRRPAAVLGDPTRTAPKEFVQRITTSPYVCTLPISGTRQMAGHGPIPGRSIINFSPVPSRQILGSWVEGFTVNASAFDEWERRRITALFLFFAYVHTEDEFMPLLTMLAGHPNFLADVKAVPPAMAFLFPDHPLAPTWADMWEKCVELNTRFNTRPAVAAWSARGGRWTENLGTYVWAFLRPSLRTDYLLKLSDGNERFLSPQLADMAEWLTNVLSAPFDGESEQAYQNLLQVDQGREWGVVGPGEGPRRVDPPQGAHSEQRISPRSLWYLGTCLMRYAPLAAEHAMWAARPTDLDAESRGDAVSPWDAPFRQADNRGTNPHLRSAKFTGYGLVLRSGVDTKEEISVHLQQIDEGPNYRWGRAGEGGCGILYFYAAGKSYSYTAPEDVGDRDDQDTDFCTTFGVFKDGRFRSIGMNGLSRPLYDLGVGQLAEIVPRQGASAYSSPEYLSRSVLLAGRDYFVLYDSLSDQALIHRLTWFVRKGDPLPNIQLLLGAFGSRETQRTDLSTASCTGVWFDGLGDSMAVVSHRKDVHAEGTAFGCRVTLPGATDLVFRRPDPVRFSEGSLSFEGTAGLIRSIGSKIEFALFHGTHIGVPGLSFFTSDQDLGISGRIEPGRTPAGEFYAPTATSLKLSAGGFSNGHVLYVDGVAIRGSAGVGSIEVKLAQGRHRWQFSDTLPVPNSPAVIRTENRAGGGRVVVEPVSAATHYRLELSADNGATWSALETTDKPLFTVAGLTNDRKVHVRAVALNERNESAPGPEYPLYVSSAPPPAPDGLRIQLASGTAELSWGEILGAAEYRLYARAAPEKEFRPLFRGRERSFVDRRSGIRACDPMPSSTRAVTRPGVVEYYVTAVNGNGESSPSRVATTDPAAWRNWDPRPGEKFRRVTSFAPDSPEVPGDVPRYYP
jgi:hypothetical protein